MFRWDKLEPLLLRPNGVPPIADNIYLFDRFCSTETLEEEEKEEAIPVFTAMELQHNFNCTEFKLEELKKATNNFDKTLKLGEGTYGDVYKGVLHHTHVAIKKLKLKDDRGFNEEIQTLSKVRHPNLVTLIGACMNTKSPALVYEYLPLGSLEDHLKNKNQPLTGKTRIRIALDICSALCFLHSSALRSHGDLKPANILLDSNYVSKLSDFGTCRQLKSTAGTVTPSYQTENVTGTLAYMEPDYIASGRMTSSFDVYSFGLVLLQLATGEDKLFVSDGEHKTALRDIVETAIEDNKFDQLVDTKWPSKEAPEKMAKLGLQCFEHTRPRWGHPARPTADELYKYLMDIDSNE